MRLDPGLDPGLGMLYLMFGLLGRLEEFLLLLAPTLIITEINEPTINNVNQLQFVFGSSRVLAAAGAGLVLPKFFA